MSQTYHEGAIILVDDTDPTRTQTIEPGWTNESRDAAILAFFGAPKPDVPETISEGQFMEQLAVTGDVTWDECTAYLATGAVPAVFAAAIAKIPTDQDPNAQAKARARFIGANSFDRHNPLTETLGALMGKSPADLDAIWIAASAIM